MDPYLLIVAPLLGLMVVTTALAFRLDFSWKGLGDWLLLHVFVDVYSGYSTPSLTPPLRTPSSTKQIKCATPTLSKQRYPLPAYENVQFWWTVVLLSTLPLIYWGFWISFAWVIIFGAGMTYYELFIAAPKQLKAHNTARMVKLEKALQAEHERQTLQLEEALEQAGLVEAHVNIQKLLAEAHTAANVTAAPEIAAWGWSRTGPNYWADQQARRLDGQALGIRRTTEAIRAQVAPFKPPPTNAYEIVQKMALKPLESPLEPVELEAIMQRNWDHLAQQTSGLTISWGGDKIPYEDR